MVYKQPTAEERCEIYELRQQRLTLTAIGKKLGRNQGPISRELKRSHGQRGYRPGQAQEIRDERARERRNQTWIDAQVWDLAQHRLRENLSLEWNSGRFAADGVGQISHHMIYSLVYAEKKGRRPQFLSSLPERTTKTICVRSVQARKKPQQNRYRGAAGYCG